MADFVHTFSNQFFLTHLSAAHPQLVYKFIRQTLQPGPPVSLKCIATGNPTPQLRWTLDGFPLPQSERRVATNKHKQALFPLFYHLHFLFLLVFDSVCQ